MGLLRVGGLCHFCVRPWAARVVFPLLRRALRALAVWLRCSLGGEPRGARAGLVRWSVPVSGTGVIAPRLRGGVLGGLSPDPLRRPLAGRGLPWLRVRGVLSPRQRVGRRRWEGGGR